ncbi:tyrosine-type recombinase/integrase [Lentzea kentuckyensis]|uniref:tyrosine-type recombinase/integrase n=1 Tax=Lentzea kentuckyensis TaxID=360086 RepID=UPI000A36B040|nr:site-specific integrase [Lentzea kentuckyensis]
MSSDAEKLRLAQNLVEELGIRWADVTAPRAIPTISEYLPHVVAAATPAQRDKYANYWSRAELLFGDRRLDELRTSDILALQQESAGSALRRSNNRNGRHAGEGCIRAMRLLYRLAVADGLISSRANPANRAPLPRRLPNLRRALTVGELAEIYDAAYNGGNDVVLDALLLRLHVESACRRGGALALSVNDLDETLCSLRLREKGGTTRMQPISRTLCSALRIHAQCRGAVSPTDTLLRYANHTPLTSRRYDHLWSRIRAALPWAAKLGVSTHWLRHTTLTWVERNYSYGIARAYAGHTDTKGGSTLTYIKGVPSEVATALSALTGKPHPLSR